MMNAYPHTALGEQDRLMSVIPTISFVQLAEQLANSLCDVINMHQIKLGSKTKEAG